MGINKPPERYALSWFISHNRLVTFFNYHLNLSPEAGYTFAPFGAAYV